MNNRRSYLDAMNAGRRRRASTSLEQLSKTLDELESRIGRGRDDRAAPHRDHGEAPFNGMRRPIPVQEDRHVARELDALREELRHHMGTGLRREFGELRGEIERALQSNSGAAGQAAELRAEFDRLSAMIHKLSQKSDDRQINLLRLEMEEVKGALGKLAREETVQSFDRRWDEFDRRWSDIASRVSAASEGNGNRVFQALSDRLEQIGEAVNALPTSVTLRSLEDRMNMLSATVDQFAHQQDRLGPEALDAIEERLDEISRAVAASTAAPRQPAFDLEPFERIEARISSLARRLDEATDESHTSALTNQLATLSGRVEELAHRVDLPEHVVTRLAEQIEIIAGRLDDGPAAPDLDAVFHGLESRLAGLSSMLEQRHEDALAQGQALFRDLERRLEDVAAGVGERSSASAGGAQILEAMDARFAELASRLERQAEPARDDAMRELEARIETMSNRIDESARGAVDPELIRSLESQIAGLAAHLSQPASAEVADIRPRLDRIEQSITDGRQDVLEAARRAAEEAVRGFSGSSGDATLVAGLAEDLKSLEELTRRSDDRNARTFEAIHDTLLKIVDRLGALETARAAARDTIAQAPSLDPAEAIAVDAGDREDRVAEVPARQRTAAAAAAEAAADALREETGDGKRSMLGGLTRAFAARRAKGAPAPKEKAEVAMPAAAQLEIDEAAVEVDAPLDPQVANRPLEPGSGAPDLNAIMKRVRDERGPAARGPDAEVAKSDFIAAARRAAQAAAAEAEIMKRHPASKGKAEGFSFGRLLSGRRKPILMGVAAVLIALAALQGGRTLLGGGDEVALAPAPVELEAVAAEDEPDAVETAAADETPEQPEQPVRVVGEAKPAPAASARSMIASVPQNAQEVSTSWLDSATTTALPPREELAEIDALPEPSEEMLAAIPVTAGPVALREAAAAGDPKALFEIGNRYAEGRGLAEDMAAAAEWYERAADEGLAPAQYRIGNLYEKGVGVARDIAKAKTWYQLAATQGNASAMHNLAVLYAMGADGVTDNDSAGRWFTEAAQLGVRDSQYNLGILSAKGVGVKQDLEAAYKWFALVAKAGDRDAAEKRDEVAGVLSPEQLDKARAAAELWRARPVDPEANSVEIPESWSEGPDTTAGIDMRQAVRNIQQILNRNGYQAGAEDGLMGQRTKSAIAAFQKDNGMAATGEIDEPLVRALLGTT